MFFDIIGKLAKGNTLVWMNSVLLFDYPIVYNTKVKTTKKIVCFSYNVCCQNTESQRHNLIKRQD